MYLYISIEMHCTVSHKILGLIIIVVAHCAPAQHIDYNVATTYNKHSLKEDILSNIYEARSLEFGFPSLMERERVIKEGLYKEDSVIPIDVDVYYPRDHQPPTIFITTPRFTKGVPYSLAFLTNTKKANGTELQAYPSYEWHRSHGADCNGLTSIYRIQIDSCGRIWILDSGEIDFVHYCTPQVMAIDLESGQILHRHNFPKGMYKQNVSRFVTITVDVDPSTCNADFIYMADSIGNGIVVHDLAKDQSWRIENKYTYPHPEFGTFTIAGESFELWDGTIGLTLTPKGLAVDRMMYFHSLSSDWQMSIPLAVVNNGSNWKLNDMSAALDSFVRLGKRGSQCVASTMSETGLLICGLASPCAIHGWDILTEYKQNARLLIEDKKRLQFVSGLKVVKNNFGVDELWVLTNKLQKAFGAGLNFKEINFRILKCKLEDLLV